MATQAQLSWLDEFRAAVEMYYQDRPEDPFMEWFRDARSEGGFVDDLHVIVTILAQARFDQLAWSHTAVENTKMVYPLLSKRKLSLEEVPKLKSIQYRKPEDWRRLFYEAHPSLRSTAMSILDRKEWAAPELEELIAGVPEMDAKTSRVAVKLLLELVPDIVSIDVQEARVPIDRLVYRVACRLGIVDPETDKPGSPSADRKIQEFAELAFPGEPLRIDEPMWSVGRSRGFGGYCYRTDPECRGCLFEAFCPKLHRDRDPSPAGSL